MRARWLGWWMLVGVAAGQVPMAPELVAGRDALQAKDFVRAEGIFAAYAKTHPNNAQAAMGEGDAEMGMHRYETAEMDYRRAVAIEPELWVAHKSLVLVEAKLGRWEEFDRERALLRGARERGAPNITARESDEIDSFTVNGKLWLVREYFEPVGRSEARYNFEHFSAAGKVEEYVSLEPVDAAAAALKRDEEVKIGGDAAAVAAAGKQGFALNWYTGKGHGTIRRYGTTEPTYEVVRGDLMRWLRGQVSK